MNTIFCLSACVTSSCGPNGSNIIVFQKEIIAKPETLSELFHSLESEHFNLSVVLFTFDILILFKVTLQDTLDLYNSSSELRMSLQFHPFLLLFYVEVCF